MMKSEDNRRWCLMSRRHRVFFVLVLGVVLFFQYTNMKGNMAAWNPKQWMQNHSSRLFFPFRKQNISPNNTNGSEAEPTADAATVRFTASPTSAVLPHSERISSKQEPKTEHQTTAPLQVTQQVVHKQTFVSGETNRSDESTAAAATVRFTASPTSASHQTTSEVTQQVVHQQTAQPTPVPYVSPGPYLVEYPHEYHLMINEPQGCEQEKPFVVLMVPVAPRNRDHRDVIRSTWGNQSLVLDKVVTLFFLLGMQTGDDAQQVHEQLLQESKEHRDLIQSDFVDCYKNLTIKTMVMLEWLNSYCSGASYAMKIDSDMFLNVPNLVKMLLNAPKTNYLTGLVAYGGAVLRDPSSKWYLPHELFSESVYPPYALGLGYILSLDLPVKLIEASRHVKALYIEDVFLGLCMKHLGIAPTDPPSGGFFHVFPLNYNRCAFSKIIATTTELSTDRVWLWKDFKTKGPYC